MKKSVAGLVILALLSALFMVGCGENQGTATSGRATKQVEITDNGMTFGNNLTIGAFYYPWYGTNIHWRNGYLRGKLKPAQKPYLGEYECSDPRVAEQHIKWAKEYGIDYFLISWWGPNGLEDYNLQNGYLKASNVSDVKFGILYETAGRLKNDFNFTAETEKKLTEDFDYLASKYFKLPNYLKYQGKPVVYFYLSRTFSGDYVNVISDVKKYIKQKYGMDLFIIGDEIYWGQFPGPEKFKILDATSMYNFHNIAIAGRYAGKFDFFERVEGLYKFALQTSKDNKKYFIPDVLPGYNDLGVRPGARNAPIPREVNKGEEGQETLLSSLLELAYKYVDPDLNTILVTSWNEWHEDTQIEPTARRGKVTNEPQDLTIKFSYAPYGFKDLEIIKAFKEKYAKK